jgi:hypothetical protein
MRRKTTLWDIFSFDFERANSLCCEGGKRKALLISLSLSLCLRRFFFLLKSSNQTPWRARAALFVALRAFSRGFFENFPKP